MTEEQWRPLPGWEGLYEVSDQGRVNTRRRRGTSGGIVDGWIGGNGYLMVCLSRNDQRITQTVHRLVALAFLGPCPEGMEVRHLDGNPLNVSLGNLAYGTHGENLLDKRGHGTDHNAAKERCPQGHRYDQANTYVLPSRPSARYCRECNRIRSQARRDALRAAS